MAQNQAQLASLEDIKWLSNDSTLPRIVLYHVVGTSILNVSPQSAIDDVAYNSGNLIEPATLIHEHAPEVLKIAQIGIVGPVPSSTFMAIAQHFNKYVSPQDAAVVGAVAICGVNNLDEMAFALNQTTNSPKPLILSGGLRPASCLSSDGPLNLYHAVSTAINPSSRERGVNVCLNGRIVSGQYAVKTHTGALDTFRAVEQGSLGGVIAGRPYYFYAPAQPVGRRFFDIAQLDTLPKVVLLQCQAETYTEVFELAMQSGAKGLVIAAGGAGTLSLPCRQALTKIAERGTPVVIAARHLSGPSIPNIKNDPLIHSGLLSPLQARIQLQLGLATSPGVDITGLRELFEAGLKAALFEGNWAVGPRDL